MTNDEISLKEHFDEKFAAIDEAMDRRIAAALVGVVTWKDLGLAISGVSTLLGLLFLIATKGAA